MNAKDTLGFGLLALQGAARTFQGTAGGLRMGRRMLIVSWSHNLSA